MHPKFITFKGHKYRLCDPGPYYRQDQWSCGGPTNLHRAVWADRHGPIPKGFEVHHRDGDRFNNAIGNLELISRSAHRRLHLLEKHRDGKMAPPSANALRRAAEWHCSSEGREWHRDHAVNMRRKMHRVICQICGREFPTPYPTRAKFCHQNCKAADFRRRHGRSL
jgi:hypothetical protein